MRRSLRFSLVACMLPGALLSGCMGPSVSTDASGHRIATVRCSDGIEGCNQLAKSTCPAGFETVDKSVYANSGMFNANHEGSTAKPEQTIKLTVRCH